MPSYNFGGDLSRSPVAFKFPKQGEDPGKFKAYFDQVINHRSDFRVELHREAAIARAYTLSEQWLKLDETAVTNGRIQSARYTRQDPRSKIPRPVVNEILPVVDNEASKQYRRKSTAYVRPVALQEQSGTSGGTAKANDILEWHLEAIRWARKRRAGILKEIMYGTVWFWSYLDQSFLESVRIGITDARRCMAGCDFLLAEPSIEQDLLRPKGISPESKFLARSQAVDQETGTLSTSLTAKKCLKCGAPLDKYTVPPDQVDTPDFFGRDLAQEVPLNQPNVEIVPLEQVYPDNDGVGIDDPSDLRTIHRVSPRHLDWVKEHYAHIPEVEDLKPDSPNRLAELFPVDGVYGHGSSLSNRNLWRNHVMVRTGIQAPTMDSPMGRYVEMAGKLLLRDEELHRPSKRKPDITIPLVKVSCARFIPKDGEIMGQGVVRALVSPQNRVNMIGSQTVDIRQRNGVSAVMVREGTVLSAGWLEGFSGRIIRWRPDPAAPPGDVPQFIDTKMIDSGAYTELEYLGGRIQNISGGQDVDIGKAPRNVSAATAIQLLLEQVSARREGREQELQDAFREVFSHQLLLLSEFAEEPRTLRRQIQNGKWEYTTFSGLDLEGHTDVMVEEQAGYDAKAFEREVVVQAIQLGLIQVTTPYARREALKALGMTSKPIDEENIQVSDAESKWYAFRDYQIVPVPDPALDDHYLMFTVYGRFLKSNEGVQLAKDAGWAEILPLIAGWEKKRQKAVLLDEMVRGAMAGAQRGDPVALMTVQGMQAQGADLQAMLLPPDVVGQILTIWGNLGVPVDDPFVQYQATVRSHLIMAEEKKAQAMVQPTIAAPGGSATPAGTEPVLGSSPAPGEGTPNEASGLTNPSGVPGQPQA